jgi:vancomycin resistance protein YoaR
LFSFSGTLPRGALAALALPALVLLGFELATWDRVAPGVVALGTPLGGLSREEAAQRLHARAESLLDRHIQISGPGLDQTTWDRSPRELGLGLAPDDILDASYAVGRVGNPVRRLGAQLSALAGGRDIGLGMLDTSVLDAALADMASAVDRPVVDAAVGVDDQGGVHTTAAQAGRAVDIDASARRLAAALEAGDPRVDLVVRVTQPKVTDAMAEPARVRAEQMLGGPGEAPLVLTFQDQRVPLTKADIAPLLAVQPAADGSHLEVHIDAEAVGSLAHLLAAEIHQDPVDARFDWNGGDLKVIRPSSDGRDLDADATRGLLASALANGTRTLALPVTTTPPAVSSADPQALGIRELIDKGSTSFAGSIPEKKANIKLAAEKLNGTVVPPGGTFSFNKEVGPTTLDAGFQWGFAIEGGSSGPKTVPSVAGGICQVATTLFQPVFWAGYALEERSSHAYWIPAYTSRGVVGLDVTVDPDTGLDFKWTNPTDDYVLVQAGVRGDGETVEFALYGRKPDWKVQVDAARVSNPRPADPTPIQQEEPSLAWGRSLQVESARDGFDVEVTRTVSPSAGDPRTLRLHTSYQPSHTVTLIGVGGQPT